jgi:hypothetical protein
VAAAVDALFCLHSRFVRSFHRLQMPDCYKGLLRIAFDNGMPVNGGYAASIAHAYCWNISFGRAGRAGFTTGNTNNAGAKCVQF